MNRNKGNDAFADWPCYVELKTQIEAQKAAERARKIAARKAKERKNAERVAIGTGRRGRRPLQLQTFVKTGGEEK